MPRKQITNFGKSILFNGTSDYLTIPVIPSLTSFSIAFWLFPRSHVTNARIVDYGDGGPSGGFNLAQSATKNKIAFNIFNSTSNVAQITAECAPGVWNHFVATYAVNSAVLYRNAVYQGGDFSCTMSAPTQTLTVGRRSSGSSNFFSGYIDDLLFYNNKVLSQEEIDLLFFNGTVPSGATSHYNFNDTVADQSGNSNNATLNGTAYSTHSVMASSRTIGSRNLINTSRILA